DQDEPRKREVLPEEDFESVQDLLKKSSWSDFAPEPRYGFEDDGEYIDSEDMLDIDIPSPYQFEQEDPLDDF
ncbi:MAG TPA: hypothetical protein V6D20_12195, partial [Candidatus Obscuribacterales bacterium]